jgi:hypothetical protein
VNFWAGVSFSGQDVGTVIHRGSAGRVSIWPEAIFIYGVSHHGVDKLELGKIVLGWCEWPSKLWRREALRSA